MQLIDNAGKWYKFASVHGVLLMTAWGMLPQSDQAALVEWIVGTAAPQPYIMPALAFLTIYLRLVKQASVSGEAP